MIVIATNNGYDFLKKSLDSLSNIGVKIPISIIDTNSTDEFSVKFIQEIKTGLYSNLDIKVLQTPYCGFDTGAYIYAMKNIYSDRYYFIHDSLIIKYYDFFNEIDKLLEDGVVVSLLEFWGNSYDNQEQVDFCIRNIGSSYYDKGIFGPIFSILRSDVDKIIDSLNFYPEVKNNQMAMERGWSVIFKLNNINIKSLCGFFDINKIINDKYEYFTKYLPNRNYRV